LRFCAGALLATKEGLPLGALCVLDAQPRPDGLSGDQREMLLALARQVMTQLELRRAVEGRVQAEAAHARIEQALKSALLEKELMMQEVHHRVKNSLQMVQNLLLLQARSVGEGEAARQLKEGAARVNIFASLHHQLYLTADGGQMQVVPYLEGLIHDLREGIGATLDGRRIEQIADPAMWPPGDVPTLGLVLTELVTNALKHGLGVVRVVFRQEVGAQAVLTVEDEGAGLPEDFGRGMKHGLGMRLVTRLLSERGGGLEVDRRRAHSCLVVRLPRSRG
jgi:two-component sensor histidine kinase